MVHILYLCVENSFSCFHVSFKYQRRGRYLTRLLSEYNVGARQNLGILGCFNIVFNDEEIGTASKLGINFKY